MHTKKPNLTTVLNARDWHWARINRFDRKAQNKGEDIADLARSVRIANAITDAVGDGMFVHFPAHLAWAQTAFRAA